MLVLTGVLASLLGATTQIEADGGAPGRARHVLSIHAVPSWTPAVVVSQQAFRAALKSTVSDPLVFHAEHLDLGMSDDQAHFETELVAYLSAKYARTTLDLVFVDSAETLDFALRHRARLFPGVPLVFTGVRLSPDVPVADGVSGVWLAVDWAGTLAVARRLQPDLEQAVVVTGASPIDRRWATEARAQLARLSDPPRITYLDGLPMASLLDRVGALPPRTVVLLGAFLVDGAGRRFTAVESTPLISAASAVPVYGTSEVRLGHGVVGGHLISFERQGRQVADVAARLLRGERPPPVEGRAHAYRFDARQLRRWGLDASRLPPGSTVEFAAPTVWQAYRGYIAAGVLLLALQSWMIVALLASRAQRRRAQEALAGRLRFETLLSNLLAGQLTVPPGGLDAQVSRALALIGADLDVDRMTLAERNATGQTADVTHTWTCDGIPEMGASIPWSEFPWMAERLAAGETVIVSPRRPLPPGAETDRRGMRAYGARSVLAVPLVTEAGMVGVLSCATVRAEREWPDLLIERLQLLARVFASVLARRRAEATARESEERVRQLRQELTHALRVHTLGELGASLAHEINQPLSAILINARVMGTLLERGADAQATMREALADIAADAKRAGDIIARLRALSRKEHARERGLHVDALVDEVAGLVHQDFVRRHIRIRRRSEPGLPTVSGDRIQLQQVFLNLLVNASEALEHTGREGREVTISTRCPAPGLVEVAVRDTGAGARDVDVKQMFERFVSTKPGGIGMGLAISRSIVEAHGGRIYARANPDQGLTVFVELPADAGGAPQGRS